MSPSHRAAPAALLALLAVGAPARAGLTSTSSDFSISYGDCGTWNSGGAGFQLNDPSLGWTDLTWSGTPWQQLTLDYTVSGVDYRYEANDADGVCDFSVLVETGSSDYSTYVYGAGHLELSKHENATAALYYTSSGTVVNLNRGWVISFEIYNPGTVDATDVYIMHAVDANPEYTSGSTSTYNDVLNIDTRDALPDFVGSGGYNYDSTLAYALLDTADQWVGGRIQRRPPPSLSDPNGAFADRTIHCRRRGHGAGRRSSRGQLSRGGGTHSSVSRYSSKT